MRASEVPQDPSFYRGIKRACYALDENGNYVIATSKGWDTERVVTEQALLDLEAHVEEVRAEVEAGKLSPLAYHLATHMMTPKLFAQHVGVATWRVKRQFKPAVFAKLSQERLALYADCLDMTVEDLQRCDAAPGHVFIEGVE